MNKRKKSNKNVPTAVRREGTGTLDPISTKQNSSVRKGMLFLLLGLLFGLIVFVGCHADAIAHRFIFHPWRYTGDFSTESFREIRFQNQRGETLVGYYFPYAPVAGGPEAVGSILYCHGNGTTVKSLIDFAWDLGRDLSCNVLIFDYAGYGLSEGEPTTVGILEDGRAARDRLARETGLRKEEIIVYGQSLGGSVAVDIAAGDGARALIVESSFTSLGDMGRRIFPFVPVNWLLKERLASIEKIGEYHGPVFISHGESDETIPFSQGRRLFQAANEPKTFYIPPEGLNDHSAPHCPEHREQLREFIRQLP